MFYGRKSFYDEIKNGIIRFDWDVNKLINANGLKYNELGFLYEVKKQNGICFY